MEIFWSFLEQVRKEMLLTPKELKPLLNRSSQMAALDYFVSLASDVFIPTYYGNMAKVVEGHRRCDICLHLCTLWMWKGPLTVSQFIILQIWVPSMLSFFCCKCDRILNTRRGLLGIRHVDKSNFGCLATVFFPLYRLSGAGVAPWEGISVSDGHNLYLSWPSYFPNFCGGFIAAGTSWI